MGDWPILEDLDLPLRRFESSFDRGNIVDRFIDHWIAFRVLLSSDERDVKRKMCARLAQFIGTDASDRWEIFSDAKASYGARCDVVHGRELERLDFLSHASTAESYLRRSLVKCLTSQSMPDKEELKRHWDLRHPSNKQNC